MLLGNNNIKNNHIESENNENIILYLLTTAQYAEAYQLLIVEKEQRKNLAVLFNLALCYFQSQQYTKCVYNLDEAYELLNITPSSQRLVVDDVYKTLHLQQRQAENYKYGITKQQLLLFPETVKDSIVRLKIDCFLCMEQWGDVLELSSILKNKKYENVESAILIAENKIELR